MLHRAIKRLASVWSGEYLAFGGEDGGQGAEFGELRRWERCKNWSDPEVDCDAPCGQGREIGGDDDTVECTSRAGNSHGEGGKKTIGERNLEMKSYYSARKDSDICRSLGATEGRSACRQYTSATSCAALTETTHLKYYLLVGTFLGHGTD